MTDPGRSGYAVSAGKDGDPTVTSAAVQGAVSDAPGSEVEAAIIHLRAALRYLEAAEREAAARGGK